MSDTDWLLNQAGNPIGPTGRFKAEPGLLADLLALLSLRNGFFAFGRALLIRPAALKQEADIDALDTWNRANRWRDAYGELDEPSILFFAENAFGDQFGIRRGEIVSFDAETAETEVMADSLQGWIAAIATDVAYWTGAERLADWEVGHGRLRNGFRLLPRRPIVLGGQYTEENLMLWRDVDGMRSRGFLARKIHDLPDGASIEFMLEP